MFCDNVHIDIRSQLSIVPSGLVLETLCIDSSTDGGLFSIVGPAAAWPRSSHTA